MLFEGTEQTGLIAYPGSLDLSPSDGFKDIEKGFFDRYVGARTKLSNWIKLDNRRPVLTVIQTTKCCKMKFLLSSEKLRVARKPIVALTILGEKIDSKIVAMNLSKLNESCLHYVWRIAEKHDSHLKLVVESL